MNVRPSVNDGQFDASCVLMGVLRGRSECPTTGERHRKRASRQSTVTARPAVVHLSTLVLDRHAS